MAKLGSYYGLCPLIDQHSLLGISEAADVGHVIVTLGKNIAVKYKLSDQKQVHSWRTKDKFSSPIIFDREEGQYMAIFNQTNLRMWVGYKENLDKLKKYTFNKLIHTIMICKGNLFIVFQNGGILPLKAAVANRKDLIVDDVIDVSVEEISDIIHTVVDSQNLTYIGMIVKSASSTCLIWTVFINGTVYQRFERINLTRNGVTLAGYVLCQTYDKHVNLLTLWSDGKLFARSLTGHNEEVQSESGVQYANIESVSCKQFVTMTTINSDYIAMYGAECNQEGASLVLYNLQFKVSQSKQSFKMFSNVTKIWCIEDNLLICVGQNLAVVPVYLSIEQLAALIGSHVAVPSEKDPDVAIVQDLEIVKWDIDDDNTYMDSIPNGIKSSVLEFLQQGLSESIICEHLIPLYIENDDTESIADCLDYFKDVPETCIVKLLRFCIQTDTKLLQSVNQDNLINSVLVLPSSDVLLLPHVRRELDVNSAVLLLRYICRLLSSDGHCLPELDVVATEKKLIEWGCVLLDGSYQKFLLTRDEQIRNVLNEFRNLVESHLNYLEELNEVFPYLTELKRKGASWNKNRFKTGQTYSIEQINLY